MGIFYLCIYYVVKLYCVIFFEVRVPIFIEIWAKYISSKQLMNKIIFTLWFCSLKQKKIISQIIKYTRGLHMRMRILENKTLYMCNLLYIDVRH
jgi:hypothetical protein